MKLNKYERSMIIVGMYWLCVSMIAVVIASMESPGNIHEVGRAVLIPFACWGFHAMCLTAIRFGIAQKSKRSSKKS